jgi:hypothetical protein
MGGRPVLSNKVSGFRAGCQLFRYFGSCSHIQASASFAVRLRDRIFVLLFSRTVIARDKFFTMEFTEHTE